MNFPDLETCKLISTQFPESEYVWILRGRSKDPTQIVVRRGEMVFGDELLANAPICEELGEWLNGNFAFMGINGTEFEKIIMSCFWHYTETETQARAEAVALAIKNNQGVVE